MRSATFQGVQLTFAARRLFEILNLGQCRVLSASTEKVAEAVSSYPAITALVEEGKGLLVVGGSLRIERVRRHGSI